MIDRSAFHGILSKQIAAYIIPEIQGAPKSNYPRKNNSIRYCSTLFRQIYTAYRGGCRPHIVQISLQYLVAFKNYNYLNKCTFFNVNK